MQFIDDYLAETVAAFAQFSADGGQRAVLLQMAAVITERFRAGGKLLICGNGGSAADAQHIAGEFVARLMFDRDPLPALALTTDSSVLTATGNDYGYAHVFERQVRALGREGDVLLGISTSGGSANVLAALEAGRARGLRCLGFAGAPPGPMAALCELTVAAPSRRTAIIQQVHITAAHVICALVERAMFPAG